MGFSLSKFNHYPESMILLPSSPGQCLVCRKEITRKSAEMHLISYQKQEKATPPAFLIEVTAENRPEYWMYLSCSPDATLDKIDILLKQIWMGDDHLSLFTIEGEEYVPHPERSTLKVKVKELFRPGIAFTYAYNFYSPTVLHLVVLMSPPDHIPPKGSICVVARNSRIPYDCDLCGDKAEFFCDECYLETGAPLICKDCLREHDCSDEQLQVIPNTPVIGIEPFTEEPDLTVRWYPDGWTKDEIIAPELYEMLDEYYERDREEYDEGDLRTLYDEEEDGEASVQDNPDGTPFAGIYDEIEGEEIKGNIPSLFAKSLIDHLVEELLRSQGLQPRKPPQQEPLSIDRYDKIRAGIEDFCRSVDSPPILEGCILMLDCLAGNLKSPLHKGNCMLWSSAIIFTQYQENGFIKRGDTTSCAEMIAAFFGVKPNMTRISSSEIRTALDMKWENRKAS